MSLLPPPEPSWTWMTTPRVSGDALSWGEGEVTCDRALTGYMLTNKTHIAMRSPNHLLLLITRNNPAFESTMHRLKPVAIVQVKKYQPNKRWSIHSNIIIRNEIKTPL